MEQDRAARFGEVAHQQIELVLGADIDAARRIEEEQDAAFGEQPLGDRDLLLVAAGEGAGAGPERARVDLDAVEDAGSTASVSASPSIRPQRGEAVDHRQRDVVLAVELEEQRLGLAVLRHQADADIRRASRRAARSIVTGRPSTANAALAIAAMPKQARNSSSWPMPCRPATPRISPCCRVEAGILRACRRPRALARRSTGRRRRRTRCAGRGGKVWAMRAADDHLGSPRRRRNRATCAGARCAGRCAGRSAGRRRRAPRAGGAR